MKLLIILLGLTNASGYFLNRVSLGNSVIGSDFFQKFSGDENNYQPDFKKYNSLNSDNKKTAIFLPALTGNSITSNLYENFLTMMTKKSFDVYVPNNDLQPILDDINNTNQDITLISHSSSAISAIDMADKIDNINTLVLIDPLDTNKNKKPDKKVDYEIDDINKVTKADKENPKIDIDNIDKLLIINTQKSKEWSVVPFIFPIDMLSLKLKRLNLNTNITQDTVKADEYGHFDILDDRWSNMIHNSLSRGCDDRDPSQLELFRAWVTNKINDATA